MTAMTKEKSQTKTRGAVAALSILKKLPPALALEAQRKLVEKKCAKHDSVFLDGDRAAFAWFVKEGHVKAVTHAANGRCQALCLAGPGRLFGACCSLGRQDYVCQAVAETDATVVGLPMDYFLGLLARCPEFAAEVMAQISERLRHAKQSQVFEQESVEKRILRVLMDLVGEYGQTVPLTKREVAEMAGTTVETCIRTFSRLEEEGLVSTERGRITVKRMEELEDRLDEE